jgi:hypothetical protein
MSLYSIVAALHVIAAVGGLGQISAIGVMARKPEFANLAFIRQLMKGVGGTLIVMLVTGVLLLWLSDWIYARAMWFNISFVLFLGLGALHGIAQSTVKKIAAAGQSLSATPLSSKLRTVSLLMSITLAAIVFFMEAKPFS